MYLLALIPAFIVVYFLLIWWIRMFFDSRTTPSRYDIFHIAIIAVAFLAVILLVTYIPDVEFANRIQHALGGWFLIVLTTFFATQASGVSMTRFQFFFLSLLLATWFGVANELAESVFQIGFGMSFAPNIADTWLDLWANSIWALIGASIFTYLIWKKI